MISKVIDAIKSGDFFWKTEKKIYEVNRSKRCIHIATNKDTKANIYQNTDYKKLYKKYENIIDAGVDEIQDRKYSNKVWVCWLQGIEEAPSIVKACVNSMKRSMPDKEIIILTYDNYQDYVTFPDYIIEKFSCGKIGFAHFSDLLRISLIAKWGGMWVDSTALCTNKEFFDFVSQEDLFVFKQLNLGNRDNAPILASNWFISAKTQDPIITLTRDLLFAYWKDYNFAINYFIFHLFFAMACRRYKDKWDNVPVFNNNSPHVLMFELDHEYSDIRWKQIMGMSGIHKLQRYDDFSHLKNSNYNKILKEYLD